MKIIDLNECEGFIFEARIDGVKYGYGADPTCQVDNYLRRDLKPGLSGVHITSDEPILITDEVFPHIRLNGIGALICTKPLTVLCGELRLLN